MQTKNNITKLIGKTPLVRLFEIERYFDVGGELYAKLEKYNPSGSVKDRAAFFMINDAYKRGLISFDSTVIEPTSGNLGISLAMLSTSFGYHAIIVMPDNVTPERAEMIKAYGGEVVFTDGKRGMTGAIERAEELLSERKNAYMPSQFINRENLMAHYYTTGPEIYLDLSGRVDYLIGGVGSGGTVGGAGRFLKEKIPSVRVVAVEPRESAVLSGEKSAPHGIFGIGAGFVPPIFDANTVDEIVTTSTEEAVEYKKILASKEGLFMGHSSGAALCAGVQTGRKSENKEKRIVMIFPDGGEKYLSVT